MSVQLDHDHRTPVLLQDRVLLPERLDATTVALVREVLHEALELTLLRSGPGGADLVVDVGQVRVVDSVGLGLLLSVHRSCVREGRRLVLAEPQPGLLRLLAVTRLHRVLHLERTPQHV